MARRGLSARCRTFLHHTVLIQLAVVQAGINGLRRKWQVSGSEKRART